jgi:hypothetical protein
MTSRKSDSDYPQEEAERRRDALLDKLLHMPPSPRKDKPKAGAKDKAKGAKKT